MAPAAFPRFQDWRQGGWSDPARIPRFTPQVGGGWGSGCRVCAYGLATKGRSSRGKSESWPVSRLLP